MYKAEKRRTVVTVPRLRHQNYDIESNCRNWGQETQSYLARHMQAPYQSDCCCGPQDERDSIANLSWKIGVETTMLSHCANPQCSRPFLRLGQGKLFLVESDSAESRKPSAHPSRSIRLQFKRMERYWLCDQCRQVWTLAQDRNNGIMLLPLPPHPDGVSLTTRQAHIGTSGPVGSFPERY